MTHRVLFLLVTASVLGACQDGPSPVGPATQTAVDASVKRGVAEPIPGQYIVVFRNEVRDVKAAATLLAGKHKGRLKHTYRSALKGMALQLSENELVALRRDPQVKYVEQDQVARAIGGGTQTNPTAGLDRIDQRNLPLNSTYGYATDGSGVQVYILDTGINFGHSDFGGRALLGVDLVDDGLSGDDCTGHGTHVSGTVGGSVYGVAKKVTLYSVRVLDCEGTGSFSQVIAGVDWVTANHASPAVANMSLAGPPSAALNEAVTNSIAAGITYAVAAGNRFTGSSDSESDACNYSPSSTPLALTVSASNQQDAFASLSNYGSCVDLSAPGIDVTSAWIGGVNATATISGTSMASPHVAGTAALYLSANPDATPDQVALAVAENATPDVLTGVPAGTANRLLFTGFLGPPPPPPPSSQWSARANMLTPRSAFALGSTSTRLYAIGGNRNGTILATVEQYTAATNAWATRTRMPGARYDGNGASLINGVLYVPGGRNVNGIPTRTMYAYNVAGNTWTTKALVPAGSACGGSAVIGTQLYVLTGCNATGFRATLHRYTPTTNLWTARASAPAPHGYPAVGAIKGKLYVAGGRNASGAATATLHVYTPASNSWATKAPMPSPRYGAAGQVINDKLYVFGGTAGTGELSTIVIYDQVTNAWTTAEAMPTGRRHLAAGSIGGQLYAVGGQSGTTSLRVVERFTP